MYGKVSPLYGPAGGLVLLSGLLHFVAPIIGGLNPDTKMFIGFGIAWSLIGIGLLRRKTWLPCIAYIAMLFGTVAAYIGGIDVPRWLLNIIMVVDLLAVICLFGIIWSKKTR